MSRTEYSEGKKSVVTSESDRAEARAIGLFDIFRAKWMLAPVQRYKVIRFLFQGRDQSSADTRQQVHRNAHGKIYHGKSSREDLNMGYQQLSFPLGEITSEELRANDELRERAAARKLNGGAGTLARAVSNDEPGPIPKGDKMTPEEIAKAFGAKIVGRARK